MTFRTLVGGLLMCAFAGSPVFAKTYTCNLQETGQQSGWVPLDIEFSVAPDGQKAKVVDGIIQHYLGGPVEVAVTENSDARLTFKWNIDMTNTKVQTTRMAYRATLFKDTNTLRVHAKPGGYDNDFEGRGPCTAK